MSSDAVNKPVHQSAAEKIIVALDVPNTAEALQLCDQLPEVQFWKVGLELFIAADMS